MFRLLLVPLLLLAVAATPATKPAADPGLVGVKVDALRKALEPRGYTFEAHLDEDPAYVTFIRRIGLTRYLAEVYCTLPDQPRRINAAITTTVDQDVDAMAVAELGAMAAAACPGNSKLAEAWVRKNVGKNAETTIGRALLKLEVPSKNGRLLTITPVAK